MKRKLLALLLAAAMMFGLVACGSTETSSDASESTSAESGENAAAESDSETASADEGTYTFHGTMSSISTWSPTDAKDANEYTIREFTCSGLYAFDMNETKDGYEILPDMAAEMPEDVTAEYAGNETYGVPSDATSGYAYRVKLREDAVWEDGTPINADTYVYTMQQYLNPEMKNYIAATWYDGTAALANAESYYKGESANKVYGDAYEIVEPGTALADVGTTLYLNLNETVYLFTDYYASQGYGDGYVYSINDMYGYGEDYWSGCMIDESTYIWDKYEFDTYYEVTDEIVAELDYLCSLWGYESGYWMYMCKYEVEGGTVYGDAYEIVEPGTALADVDTDLYLNLNETVYLFTDYYASQGYGDSYVYSIAQMESFGEDYWPSLTLEDGTYIWDKYAYDTDILVTDEVVEDLDYICWLWGYDSGYWMYLCKYIVSSGETTGEATTWDQVGFIKDDDYTITFIFTQSVSEFNFESSVEGLYLLNEELYEANKQETGGVIKSSYGTDVDNYISYGPYKIASYQADKEISLTKNENWYGYSDGQHEGQYQTTDIVYSVIDEHTTAFSMFLQGELDVVGLSADEMETYANSDFCYYDPNGFFYFYVLNSDFDSLKAEEQEGENRTILSYLDFRKGISWSIDRSEYITTLNPSSEVAYGLLNDLYVYDVDSGATYRESEAAQQALCNFYGADSVDDITGYDVEKASEYIQAAYDACKADGNISDSDIVTIDFHMWGSTADYVKMVDFFEECILEACVGTDLEGRVEVNLVEDQECDTSMRSNLADVIYGSWGSTVMNPYSDMMIYVFSEYQYDASFDASSAEATIEVDGEEITMTLPEWWDALNEGEYASVDSEIRVAILAGMEQRVMENYTSIPLYNSVSATLYSQRIVLGSEDWVNSIVGYGGIQYMTYTMNDAEWEAYCAENNNQLDYQ